MPEYTFECEKCSEKITLICSMSEYDIECQKLSCQSCNGSVERDYTADNVRGSVSLSLSDCKTIGQYADKQTSKYSQRQVEDIVENFKTKKTGGMNELPTGMSRIGPSKNKTKWTKD